MNVLDIAILVFLAVGAYSGFKKGLLQELVSLSAFFIAIIVGIKLMDVGVEFLSGFIDGYENMLPFVVFVITFLIIILLLNLAGKTVKKILDLTLLGSIDDLAGALLGILKWSLVISIFLWIVASFGIALPSALTEESYLYGPTSALAPGLFQLVSGIFPFLQEFFEKSSEFVRDSEITV